jgi:Uma2 family endonuclease
MSAERSNWSAEEFLDCRFDFPESGQWSELSAGRLVHLQPPDLDHGNALLNLSKALADYVQSAQGYACFDLGLLLHRDPDTVWFPAVSYFIEGTRFAESDRDLTDTVPELVIELASTHDRRELMRDRTRRYLHWGVQSVWVIDPSVQTLCVIDTHRPDEPVVLGPGDQFDGGLILGGFQYLVGEFFAEPLWWS